eukprot:GHVQ01012341.1.p1 GENE.GHVQ01012341.1~~GHVQ01012341.1.p1  ORF type:complete len:1410 (+),score=141.62 GHVQ01012341.1:163-4392(+)
MSSSITAIGMRMISQEQTKLVEKEEADAVLESLESMDDEYEGRELSETLEDMSQSCGPALHPLVPFISHTAPPTTTNIPVKPKKTQKLSNLSHITLTRLTTSWRIWLLILLMSLTGCCLFCRYTSLPRDTDLYPSFHAVTVDDPSFRKTILDGPQLPFLPRRLYRPEALPGYNWKDNTRITKYIQTIAEKSKESMQNMLKHAKDIAELKESAVESLPVEYSNEMAVSDCLEFSRKLVLGDGLLMNVMSSLASTVCTEVLHANGLSFMTSSFEDLRSHFIAEERRLLLEKLNADRWKTSRAAELKTPGPEWILPALYEFEEACRDRATVIVDMRILSYRCRGLNRYIISILNGAYEHLDTVTEWYKFIIGLANQWADEQNSSDRIVELLKKAAALIKDKTTVALGVRSCIKAILILEATQDDSLAAAVEDSTALLKQRIILTRETRNERPPSLENNDVCVETELESLNSIDDPVVDGAAQRINSALTSMRLHLQTKAIPALLSLSADQYKDTDIVSKMNRYIESFRAFPNIKWCLMKSERRHLPVTVSREIKSLEASVRKRDTRAKQVCEALESVSNAPAGAIPPNDEPQQNNDVQMNAPSDYSTLMIEVASAMQRLGAIFPEYLNKATEDLETLCCNKIEDAKKRLAQLEVYLDRIALLEGLEIPNKPMCLVKDEKDLLPHFFFSLLPSDFNMERDKAIAAVMKEQNSIIDERYQVIHARQLALHGLRLSFLEAQDGLVLLPGEFQHLQSALGDVQDEEVWQMFQTYLTDTQASVDTLMNIRDASDNAGGQVQINAVHMPDILQTFTTKYKTCIDSHQALQLSRLIEKCTRAIAEMEGTIAKIVNASTPLNDATTSDIAANLQNAFSLLKQCLEIADLKDQELLRKLHTYLRETEETANRLLAALENFTGDQGTKEASISLRFLHLQAECIDCTQIYMSGFNPLAVTRVVPVPAKSPVQGTKEGMMDGPSHSSAEMEGTIAKIVNASTPLNDGTISDNRANILKQVQAIADMKDQKLLPKLHTSLTTYVPHRLEATLHTTPSNVPFQTYVETGAPPSVADMEGTIAKIVNASTPLNDATISHNAANLQIAFRSLKQFQAIADLNDQNLLHKLHTSLTKSEETANHLLAALENFTGDEDTKEARISLPFRELQAAYNEYTKIYMKGFNPLAVTRVVPVPAKSPVQGTKKGMMGGASQSSAVNVPHPGNNVGTIPFAYGFNPLGPHTQRIDSTGPPRQKVPRLAVEQGDVSRYANLGMTGGASHSSAVNVPYPGNNVGTLGQFSAPGANQGMMGGASDFSAVNVPYPGNNVGTLGQFSAPGANQGMMGGASDFSAGNNVGTRGHLPLLQPGNNVGTTSMFRSVPETSNALPHTRVNGPHALGGPATASSVPYQTKGINCIDQGGDRNGGQP